MKLPYDVLPHVISLSRYAKDSVQLTATCRVLYHVAPKIALKKPVVISTVGQLESFLEFLRTDNSSRCRYLKHLEVRELYPDWDVVEEFIETLPLLTSLEVLRFDETDQFLDLDPDIIPALCSITTLRYINFTGARGKAYEDTIIPAKVYPNMRKLSIEFHEFPLRIDPFIRAFPNLTDLYVDADFHGGHSSGDILECHETNVAQQLDAVDPCGTWAHLEHFRGCLFDLYIIGIASHIRRVTIDGDARDGVTLRAAGAPQARGYGAMLGNADRGFIAMLRDAEDRWKNVGAIIDDLVSALTRLPLKFLQLKFFTRDLDPTYSAIPASPTEAECTLLELDMDKLIARLEAIPSLEAAHFVLPSSRGGYGFRWDDHDRTITKGASRLAGPEQWESWYPGTNRDNY
ncbi:hypothetical protein V8D89_003637 [Ganoderma adspersum]